MLREILGPKKEEATKDQENCFIRSSEVQTPVP
jgi:hypothetical protein